MLGLDYGAKLACLRVRRYFDIANGLTQYDEAMGARQLDALANRARCEICLNWNASYGTPIVLTMGFCTV